MLTTDETGSAGVPPASLAYTAFGEPVTYDGVSETWRVGFPADGGTRYGYAGGFGYESGLITLQGVNPALPPVTLQHVDERWYDPALGRFVQRDPIGLAGGLNMYTYTDGDPLTSVDPVGEFSIVVIVVVVVAAILVGSALIKGCNHGNALANTGRRKPYATDSEGFPIGDNIAPDMQGVCVEIVGESIVGIAGSIPGQTFTGPCATPGTTAEETGAKGIVGAWEKFLEWLNGSDDED